jgi:anti-anti-sigma factor
MSGGGTYSLLTVPKQSTREVIINFRTKTHGLYEIIEPVLEENEVFDSSMLKETINSLIASGKRNFAIDMSPLDYIYSDVINMLMALNKRVLDVTGRLSLMAPQPEVVQILKRAGIHNILRIFDTEAELIRSSEDMILQTTSIKLSDVDAALKQQTPQSEFDQLRSEIGSAFGESDEAPAKQQGTAGSGDDFDQMFQQFETKPQTVNRGGGPVRGPSYPPQGQPPAAPQPPNFQPKQFTQPPAQPMPMRPAAPIQPRQPAADIPKYQADYPVRSETQRFTVAPGAQSYQEQRMQPPPVQEESYSPIDEDETFEAPARKKPERKPPVRPSFDDDDFQDDEFKKKSGIPVLVIILLIVALGGVGALVVYMTVGKKKAEPAVTAVTPPQPAAPVTPQLPVASPDTSVTDTSDNEMAAEPEKEIVESKPEVKKPPVRKAPVARRTAPAPRKRTPPPARRPAATEQNRVAISSSPSGALLLINGRKVGTTPYTWTTPVFGKISLKASKSGYKDAEKSFEFTGGSISESVTLEKEVAAAPPPPPPPPEKKQPVVSAPPVKAPPPPAAPTDDEDIDDPFADIGNEEDDFALEPEEPAKTAPAAAKAPPPPAAAPRSSGGGEALIFIASIPPVADVYLGSQLIGKTNVSELKIPAGVQTLKFVKGGKEITKQMTLQPGKNPSQMVRIP